MTKLLLICVLALAFVSAAGAATHGAWVTAAQMEDNVLDSNWAYLHDVDDVTCYGFGTPVLSSTATQTYQRFTCEFLATVTSYRDNSPEGCFYRAQVLSLRNGDFRVMRVPAYCMSLPSGP